MNLVFEKERVNTRDKARVEIRGEVGKVTVIVGQDCWVCAFLDGGTEWECRDWGYGGERCLGRGPVF